MDVLQMPVHGGGVNEIEVDYEFIEMEDGYTMISTADHIKSMFSSFNVQWKSRIEAAGDKQQYILEIVDKNYEKPIILRNMPYLSNHLSKHEGVIGVYLTLNDDRNKSAAEPFFYVDKSYVSRLDHSVKPCDCGNHCLHLK